MQETDVWKATIYTYKTRNKSTVLYTEKLFCEAVMSWKVR